MCRLLTTLLIFVLTGCVGAMPAQKADMSYQKVVELPNQSKDQIYEKSKQWIASTFKSAKAVIEYENKLDGTIIGNGSIDRPATSINPMASGQVRFLMREDIKEGKVRLTFENLVVYAAPSYNSMLGVTPGGEYPLLEADVIPVREKFDAISADLAKYILGSAKADNW